VKLPTTRIALIALGGLIALGALGTAWWLRLTPAERWVAWHGWGASDDLLALSRGEVRELTWPLVDSTVVASRGYAIVSLHDEVETELLFASDPAAVEAFTRVSSRQTVRPIRGPWYEIRVQ
jgi:hypothetical protein